MDILNIPQREFVCGYNKDQVHKFSFFIAYMFVYSISFLGTKQTWPGYFDNMVSGTEKKTLIN